MGGILSKKIFLQPQLSFSQIIETNYNPNGYNVTLPAGVYKIWVHGGGGSSGEPGGNFNSSLWHGGWGGAGGNGERASYTLTLTRPHSFHYHCGAGGSADWWESLPGRGGLGGAAGDNKGPAAGRGGNSGEPSWFLSNGAAPEGSTLVVTDSATDSWAFNVNGILGCVAVGGGGGGGGAASATNNRRYDNGGAGGGGGGSILWDTHSIQLVYVNGQNGRPSRSHNHPGEAGINGLLRESWMNTFTSGAGGNGSGGAGGASGRGLGAGGASGGGGPGNSNTGSGGGGGGGAPGWRAHGGQSFIYPKYPAYSSPSNGSWYTAHAPATYDPWGNLVQNRIPAVYGQGGVSAKSTTSRGGGTGWVSITKIG